MIDKSQLIVEVEDFDRQVIARSRQVPVLVDFWAAWCGPCRMVSPVLAKLTEEFAGAFVLAKVDTEAHPQVAMSYRVRSIPDVRLFRDGQVVDGFVGALPEARIRAFLRGHYPSEADTLLTQGAQLLDDGDPDGATAAYQRALDLDDTVDAAHFALARLALGRGDTDTMDQHLARIRPQAPERERAQHLRAASTLIREARELGSRDALEARVRDDEGDLDARYALAALDLAAGAHEAALEGYLGVAERQRRWRDEAARKAMLTVFGILGVRHPMADRYRRKLMLIY